MGKKTDCTYTSFREIFVNCVQNFIRYSSSANTTRELNPWNTQENC